VSKIEYKVVELPPPNNWNCEALLQKYGDEGWELVNIYPYYCWAYFKRTVFDLGDLE